MEGILYLSDTEQKKRFVQIDLDIFGDVWEDIEDILVARSRKNEERFSLEEVLKMINYEPK
jgi:hypothetical protein